MPIAPSRTVSSLRPCFEHYHAICMGMTKGKKKLNDTEKKEEKERYDRRSEIITVDPLLPQWVVSRLKSKRHLVEGSPAGNRSQLTGICVRYHREITLYHVAPKVVRSCLHMQQSRTLARYEFASAIPAMRFVVKLYGFSEGEAE